MYRRTGTDECVVWQGTKSEFKPLATLEDSSGGRAQIVQDDHCWVVLLRQQDGTYKPTSWIFPEALKVIQELSVLMEYAIDIVYDT
jgi:hypothetical protein